MVALAERNSFSNREDLYKGHKVVAMPSSSSTSSHSSSTNSHNNMLSVRDMVSSRNTFDPNRPRSLSAGRATTRSRDIVQEVYDRMGVNRTGSNGSGEPFDETPSLKKSGSLRSSAPTKRRDHSPDPAEKFSQRYRAAAALSSPRSGGGSGDVNHHHHRGRSAESSSGEPRRSRSLSRGRAVAGRWPPSQGKAEQSTTAPQSVSATYNSRTKVAEQPVVATTHNTTAAATGQIPVALRKNVSRSDSQEENAGSDSDSISKAGSIEKAAASSSSASKTTSVKDRISAYAGVRNSARNFPQKKPVHYQTYASRERPKPIDIYEEARKHEQASPKQTEDDVAMAPEPSAVPPSPVAAAAADAAFALVRGSSAARSVKSTTASSRTAKTASRIAGAYLGAIKSPSSSTSVVNKPIVVAPAPTTATSAPLTEISAADPNSDGHSVAASSVSADEFNFSSPNVAASRSVGGTTPGNKKPTWAERSKHMTTPPSRNTTDQSYHSNGGQQKASTTPSALEIERMVEQQVQARVSVVEMRMEEQMQRLEKRVEEKLKSRISVLDDKLDKMNSMLAMLLSRELGSSPNNNENARDNEI